MNTQQSKIDNEVSLKNAVEYIKWVSDYNQYYKDTNVYTPTIDDYSVYPFEGISPTGQEFYGGPYRLLITPTFNGYFRWIVNCGQLLS